MQFLTLPTNGGRRGNLTTLDGGVLNASTASRFEFNDIAFTLNASNTGTGNTDRIGFGVVDNNVSNDVGGNPDTGYWVQIGSDSLVAAPATGNGDFTSGVSTLFFEGADDSQTSLATFTFNNADFTQGAASTLPPVLSLAFDISADSYSLEIGGDTITILSGSLSGPFTSGITEGFATFYSQTENPGVDVAVDQILIDSVPEPSSVLLLLGGAAMMVVRRSRR